MKRVENENVRYSGELVSISTNTEKAEEVSSKSARIATIAMNE
jgi:hypothetical protein